MNLFLNADLELKNNLRNINDNDNICHGLAEVYISSTGVIPLETIDKKGCFGFLFSSLKSFFFSFYIVFLENFSKILFSFFSTIKSLDVQRKGFELLITG